MPQQIHHKKNEIQDVELFEDKECTEAFDFMDKKDLYIELVSGDITPLVRLRNQAATWQNIYTPYLCEQFKYYEPLDKIKTLDDITPNLSKYIPEDNAVLFLSEEGCKKYSPIKKYDYNQKGNFSNPENVNDVWLTTFDSEYNTLIAKIGVGLYDVEDDCLYKRCPESGNRIYFKKLTIFLPHGTQSELQKAKEVEKELKEKYGVEEVNLFVLHCFGTLYINRHNYLSYQSYDFLKNPLKSIRLKYFNKIITTNSTGILKPEDSTERLQVIDAKEMLEEYLNENNLI